MPVSKWLMFEVVDSTRSSFIHVRACIIPTFVKIDEVSPKTLLTLACELSGEYLK